MKNMHHIPVLLEEVLYYLNIKENKKYIDATFGFGGHSREILKKNAVILGLDADAESLKKASADFGTNPNLHLICGNFRDLKKIALLNGFEKVDGILFDLGLSSWQLDESKRGFSFSQKENLDMRMDLSLNVKALDLLTALSEKELARIFLEYGEEKLAKIIAKEIKADLPLIQTTSDLAQLVKRIYGYKYRLQSRRHPATKVFQALRIAVNDELSNLSEALPQALDLLNTDGRLVVISFHSLEDRIVKRFFQKNDQLEILTAKPICPSSEEVQTNPRSSSAKLRAAQKI